MLSFKLFLEQQNDKGTLYAFDIDGTLKHPTARVGVNDASGTRVKTLDHHEYNTYKLPPGHSFDYREFSSAEKFEESQPIGPMLTIAKKIQQNMGPKSRMVFITARKDFDNREQFLDQFRKHGLNMDHTDPRGIHVHRAGRLPLPTAEAKLHHFRQHLDSGRYHAVHFWDDDDRNLELFSKLKQEYPKVSFNGYKVHPDGRAERAA